MIEENQGFSKFDAMKLALMHARRRIATGAV